VSASSVLGSSNPSGKMPILPSMRTEKSRLRHSLVAMQDLMRRMRHLPVQEQADARMTHRFAPPRPIWDKIDTTL